MRTEFRAELRAELREWFDHIRLVLADLFGALISLPTLFVLTALYVPMLCIREFLALMLHWWHRPPPVDTLLVNVQSGTVYTVGEVHTHWTGMWEIYLYPVDPAVRQYPGINARDWRSGLYRYHTPPSEETTL